MVYAIITGDIKNYTKLGDEKRAGLISETEKLLQSLVAKDSYAKMFRGDSYQIQLDDPEQALKKCLQLISWFKMNSDDDNHIKVSTKLSIGIGAIAFEGKTVLDSDGEAYHLSGRNFDGLEKPELIRLTTDDEEKNELYKVILMYINMIAERWTSSQAETIYQLLDKDLIKQTDIAQQLKSSQPNVAKSLRAARWKEVDAGISYINSILSKQYKK